MSIDARTASMTPTGRVAHRARSAINGARNSLEDATSIRRRRIEFKGLLVLLTRLIAQMR
jgi:hypothetical protein